MRVVADVLKHWTTADSSELYSIRNWGLNYFGINQAGRLVVTPAGAEKGSIDLKERVDELVRRGISTPLLLRFNDLLRARVELLNECFRKAIADYGFKSTYKGVYPIKVNQDQKVVEEIVAAGRKYHYGLEAGSKPELLAVMGMLDDEEALIICNGYKDEEYIETALLASKLGRTIVLVVEKPSELELIKRIADKTGVRPKIGMRAKLATRGSGRWESSGGDRSKFGLTAREMLEAVHFLKEHKLLDGFELLHFHLGSQISAIRSLKNALREAARFYVELAKQGAPLKYFDVGGGLGVDYDGSQTNFESSMNYSTQEYANDVVYGVMEICDAEKVPHPTIVSESGRAITAHHAVLVMNVLGVNEFKASVPDAVPPDADPIVRNLYDCYRETSRKNFLEAYHDALEYKDECLTLFNLGHLSLEQRVFAENIFWALCQKVLRITRELDHAPEELEGLEKALSDTYFCNFSVFQSLPDSWAVDQLFPVVPIHRLNEEPTRRAVLADITCDSDGKLDRFIDLHDVKSVLELHPFEHGKEYHIGIFLVGAYQEILGDLHNLFGDTNTVHVALDADGSYRIEHVTTGDTVTDALKYVSYTREDLVARVRRFSEQALRAKRMTLEESRQLLKVYEEGLSGYTYLEGD